MCVCVCVCVCVCECIYNVNEKEGINNGNQYINVYKLTAIKILQK